MKRPAGVSILAIACYALAGTAAVIALLLLISGPDPFRAAILIILFDYVVPAFGLVVGYMTMLLSRVPGMTVIKMNFIFAAIAISASALYGAIARGLWNLRRWARILCSVMLVLAIVLAGRWLLRARMTELIAAVWIGLEVCAEVCALAYLLLPFTAKAFQVESTSLDT